METAKRERSEVKLEIQLVEEQKEAKRLILQNELVVLTGNSGTGKTLVVAATCLGMLFKKEIDKIYLSRPTAVVGNALGYLPGGLDEKMDPYVQPFIKNMKVCYSRDSGREQKIEEAIKKIEYLPIQFIRGHTIRAREILIVDEIQSTTFKEIEAIVERIGEGGKIVLMGDIRQKDIKEQSGILLLKNLWENIPEIKHLKLVENHRSGLVKKILDYMEINY